MPKITKQQVQHISKLARLNLTEKEVVKFQKELSLILEYIEKLKKIDLSGLKPATFPFDFEEITRKDELEKEGKVKPEKILSLAPETKNNYLKVKKILQ